MSLKEVTNIDAVEQYLGTKDGGIEFDNLAKNQGNAINFFQPLIDIQLKQWERSTKIEAAIL